jgi:deoxyadenosine/deoxycytidine kinase
MKGDNSMNKRNNKPLPQARTQAQDDLDIRIDRLFEDLAAMAEHPDLPIELFEEIDAFRKRIEERANEIALEACTAAKLRHVTSLGFKRWRHAAAKFEAIHTGSFSYR